MKEEETITIELKKGEVFQTYLSILSRVGFAQQKWASSFNAEEQKQMQSEISFLTELAKKFSDLL